MRTKASARAAASAGLATAVLLGTAAVWEPAQGLSEQPAAAAAAGQPAGAVRACSRGLLALTFDDGPQATVTPALLDVLVGRHVPATFFVTGGRVASTPRITRQTSRLGFTVGNHGYSHEDLTRLPAAGIRRTLLRTRRAIVAAGARPSGLMRPPYGNIDGRVRAVVRSLGLVPVLWTIDPRDWAGGSGADIANRVIYALRPHEENLVLLHDGVGNSPNTLAAVPRIVRRARGAGYCFARLGPRGHPAAPVPAASITDATVTEAAPGQVTTAALTVRLDRPTSRPTSVRVRTRAGTAARGVDFVPVRRLLRFPVGAVRRTVRVAVRGDALDERTETLQVRLSRPAGMRVRDGTGTVRVVDDDPEPVARVHDAAAVEPPTGQVQVPVLVRLSRPSGRRVTLHIVTADGTASAAAGDYVPVDRDLVVPAGRVRATVQVTVSADSADEPAETFAVAIAGVRHAQVGRATGTVTIQSPG